MDYLLKQQLLNALGRLTIDNTFHGMYPHIQISPGLQFPSKLTIAKPCNRSICPRAFSAARCPRASRDLKHPPTHAPRAPVALTQCALPRPRRASHTRAPCQAGPGLFLHRNCFFEMLPMRRARACCPPPFRRPCARCPAPAAYRARAPSRAYLWAGSLGFTPGAVHAPAAVAPRPAPTAPCIPTQFDWEDVINSPPLHSGLYEGLNPGNFVPVDPARLRRAEAGGDAFVLTVSMHERDCFGHREKRQRHGYGTLRARKCTQLSAFGSPPSSLPSLATHG
ncbi:hypothetical protein DFH08DRAFT_1055119 [Mycena albidolilacea]|uniref:Uncharacterized protein n=1 Tax=Mycena albidolilacea TaxID=1033008 RepID=A0AAD6Z3A3_9AGAR|nr:hypothetical protein DFH08DRAFT_1055119 [Mycena albidolilacea]